ncbi:MAG: SNF2-related protein [Sphingomicrobium sp.]
MEHIARHNRCGLFAAMGSGKCGAVLHALQAMDIMDQAPGLIVGPLRVARETWPNEVEKWDSLKGVNISPVVGSQTQRFMALKRDCLWYSINYEQIPWLVEHLGKKRWPYRTIVADESTRLKGARSMGQGGKRTNALAKIAHLPQVERFIELTGTPAPNGLKDLWGQLMYLDGGARLGASYTNFLQRWFQRSFDGHGVEPLSFAQEQIQERIGDICLTVDPRDYIDISEPIESEIVVELPPKAMDVYRAMETKMFVELEHDFAMHEVEAVHAAARTSKCLQIAAGFVYNEDRDAIPLHEAKLDALDSIREEANGMPLLVSYIFKHDLVMLQKKFPKLKHIDETSEKEWNAGHVPMMAAHPASAGHGLNLQYGSNILVDYTSGWDLEYDQQIIERIGPMRQFQSGLNRPVYRYRIMSERTADYLVKKRRQTKRSVQDILLEALKRKEKGLCPITVS